MKKQADPDLGGSWTFEAVRKFAGEAAGERSRLCRNPFKREAALFQRNGDDGRAAL
jgi:hypothetical protein